MTDELWKARFAVKRAVLDVVAFDHHEWEGSSDSAHADYLDDLLDSALEEWAEAYLLAKKARVRPADVPSANQASEMLNAYLNPNMP